MNIVDNINTLNKPQKAVASEDLKDFRCFYGEFSSPFHSYGETFFYFMETAAWKFFKISYFVFHKRKKPYRYVSK